MMNKGLSIQERGLILLIGLAMLVSGFLIFVDLPQPVQASLPSVIRLDDVRILTPQFVESEPININRASLDELIALPGIGPALAQRIIDYREANGPFQSIEELIKVSGIGPKKLEAARDQCVIADE